MSLAHAIAEAFGGCRPSGDEWKCRCPCHDDKNPSLSIKDTEDGKVLFKCFAGCDSKAIFNEAKSRGLLKNGIATKKEEIIYSYKNLDGKEICQKYRTRDPNGKKKIYFRRWENGQWTWNLKGLKNIPLYNLSALISAEVIYICEGEKNAEDLIKRGLVATTNHAGGAHWREEYNEHFKNKTIIICQDNDETGRERTQKLTRSLRKVAKEIRLFDPPGVDEAGDVSDW